MWRKICSWLLSKCQEENKYHADGFLEKTPTSRYSKLLFHIHTLFYLGQSISYIEEYVWEKRGHECACPLHGACQRSPSTRDPWLAASSPTILMISSPCLSFFRSDDTKKSGAQMHVRAAAGRLERTHNRQGGLEERSLTTAGITMHH